jgi:hypothetical protein
MPVVSNQIPNLINGVSQQSPSLRLATQAEAQVNGYSTVADGLKKRPPRILKAILADAYGSTDFIHTMNRSTTERYQLFISGGDLFVYDLMTGAEKTVAFPNGKAYLAGSNPKATFIAKTVADYTFIANKSVEVALDSGNTQPTRPNEAIIFVRAGNYARTYEIYIDGTIAARFRTGDGIDGDAAAEAQSVDTTAIAKALLGGVGGSGTNPDTDPEKWFPPLPGGSFSSTFNLKASLGVEYDLSLHGSTIRIARNDGGNFTISSKDGYGEQAMYCFKGAAPTFERLPQEAPDGIVIKITGDATNQGDHYYVQYSAADRVWEECPQPGVVKGFDAATLPHVLISEADGTFTFKEAEWDERVAGDLEIIPAPSFVGDTISDITFHRNRLIFLSGENVVTSRSGDFFNFWRTSASELLDDDPIDTSVTNDEVSILNFGVPWLGSLFLFSSGTQFNMNADPLLTPKTITLASVSDFDNSDTCPPVTVGTYAYFPVNQGRFTGVQEYFLADNVNTLYDAEPITNHVPSYVPANVFSILASSAVDLLVLLSDDEPNAIYVYKYYWQGGDKLQSSWSKWTVEEGSTVLWAELIDSTMHLTVNYADGSTALEQMPLEVSYTDGNLGRPVLLDRRVTEAELSPSYSAITEKTTFTLPYATVPGETIECYTAEGQYLQVEDLSGSTFTVAGDWSATPVFAGTPYVLRYKLSELFYREPAGNGTRVQTGGRLQLHHILFTYADTAYFRVEVTPRGRQTYSYSFEGRRSGESGNQIGEVPSADGTFKVPLFTTSEGLGIEVINDTPFPSNILSAEWRALFVPRRIN